MLERLLHGGALLAGGGRLAERGLALLKGQRGQSHEVFLSFLRKTEWPHHDLVTAALTSEFKAWSGWRG
ncbi:hypothetical protein GCM10010289_81330 [Streptomyces violascens]|uniref:Transposase n=1 Tax=Streptomyces violascens TaxID=67381 RepID=A0ABQ3QRI8_9ACTN|nr:hypothetical protein GCM10010289_81330 [Streptomyces violascens]GHI39891.1 hypothetical protein Sviol_42990 [Streptomyces violascens]